MSSVTLEVGLRWAMVLYFVGTDGSAGLFLFLFYNMGIRWMGLGYRMRIAHFNLLTAVLLLHI